MSDVVIVALIGALPATLGVCLGLVNRQKIEAVHIAVNSRLTELLELTAKSSHAEGKADKTP